MQESRCHGWQTDKAAGIVSAAETLNRHSGPRLRSPEFLIAGAESNERLWTPAQQIAGVTVKATAPGVTAAPPNNL